MDAVEIKSDLHKLIDKVNDISVLSAIKTLLSKQVVADDWWDELPENVQESIEIGLKQSKEGNTIAHDVVMNDIKAKYGLSL
jgi:hypothetical protein